jgi:glycosyl transferase family 2
MHSVDANSSKASSKLISIITPTRNAGRKIAATIDSVLGQERSLFDFHILDGASVDGTMDAIRRVASGVNVTSEPDEGVYDAISQGIARSEGRFLYVLGAGDTLRPGILARVAKHLATRPQHSVVYGNVHWVQRSLLYRGAFTKADLTTHCICHQAMFIDRSLFELVGAVRPSVSDLRGLALQHPLLQRSPRAHRVHRRDHRRLRGRRNQRHRPRRALSGRPPGPDPPLVRAPLFTHPLDVPCMAKNLRNPVAHPPDRRKLRKTMSDIDGPHRMALLATLRASVPFPSERTFNMFLPVEVAVYAEHSDTTKPMAPDWNTRIFNRIEVQVGQSIRLEKGTGHVILGPGLYHITGCSIVMYNDPDHPVDGRMSIEIRPFGGYCRLRRAADVDCPNEKAIAIGTMTNSNLLPSLIDTYFNVEQETRIVLEHQIGKEIANMFLQLYVVESTWHVFARLSIERVSPAHAG